MELTHKNLILLLDIYQIITVKFNGDSNLVSIWFSSSNPYLGHVSPNEMIAVGKIRDLKTLIDQSISAKAPLQAIQLAYEVMH